MVMVFCYVVNDRSVEVKKGEIVLISFNFEIFVLFIKMEIYD